MDVNQLVGFALGLLAVTSLLLVAAFWFVVPQVSHTLRAYEKLADTLDTELKPTLVEVHEVLQGVNQLRQLTVQRVSEVGQTVTEVSHRVEGMAGSAAQVAGSAQKQSSVFSAGILAGLRSYLTGHKGAEPGEGQEG